MAYTRQPNIFIDPAGVKSTYTWTLNHDEEEEVQVSRQMADGAATNNIGLIPQEGAPYPIVFQWKGKIFTQSDKNEMDSWYALCEDQTIYLVDFSASFYEVLITDWDVQRVAGYNRRGGLPWYWQYTIIFRVVSVLSGDWSDL